MTRGSGPAAKGLKLEGGRLRGTDFKAVQASSLSCMGSQAGRGPSSVQKGGNQGVP